MSMHVQQMVASIIERDDGTWEAIWLGSHGSSGTTVNNCNNPIDALRQLADKLDEWDERQAIINAVDYEEYP